MATTKGNYEYNEELDAFVLTVKQDGIDFTITNPEDTTAVNTKISIKDSLTANGSEGFAVSVNAVDIDWNGAVLKIA